jgi:hypothetical protein
VFILYMGAHRILLLTVIVGKVVTERNIFWLLSGKLDNENHDALSPAEESARLSIFEDVVCAGNLLLKTFLLHSSIHYIAVIPELLTL